MRSASRLLDSGRFFSDQLLGSRFRWSRRDACIFRDPTGREMNPVARGRQAVEGVVDRFAELLERLGFLFVELPSTATASAESAIHYLVQYLATAGVLQPEQVEEAICRVLARERLGLTAIGEGVALPHATSSAVGRVVGVGARTSPGIPWGARDGQPVQRVCLILAPPDRPGDYLRVLEALSLGLRQKSR